MAPPPRLVVVAISVAAAVLLRVQVRGEDAAPTATIQAPPAASELTLGAISEQAEGLAPQLRAMTEAISDSAAIDAIEKEVLQYHLHVAERWAKTDRLLRETPRRARLEALASSWRSLRIEVVGLQAVVNERAGRREADLRRLDRLRTSWSWTLDQARHASAPGSIIGHVEATLAAIDAARAQVEQRCARLSIQQDSLSRQIEECDEAAARIEDGRRQAVGRVFAQHEPPIWQSGSAAPERDTRTWLAHVSDEVAARIDSLRIYVQARRLGFVFSLLLALVLALILYRARQDTAGDTGAGVALPEFAARVLHAPLSTVLLLTLMVSRPLRPDPPLTLQQAVLLAVLPAAITLLRPLVDPRLLRVLWGLAVFLVLDIARGLLFATPVVEQLALIFEMGTAAALLFVGAAQLSTAARELGNGPPWLRAAARALCRVVAVAAAAASVAAAFGYLDLADFVGGGGLDLVYVTIGLLGIRVAAGGVLGLVLVKTPLARLRTVARHGADVERGIGRALDLVLAAVWVFNALQIFELQGPAGAVLRRGLDARLQVGALDLAVGRVLGIAAVGIVAWLTSRIVVFALDEDVYARLDLPRGVPYALSSLTRYGLLLVGFLLALGALGLDLTRVTILVSAFGLGIGFGLQQIINNFVCGLILLFERPIQVSDSVQLGDLLGEVVRIGIRSSTIRTYEGAEVIVPNASLLEEKVTNWTLSDRKRRVDMDVGVAYGTDAARVIALLVEAAREVPQVLNDPAPEAFFVRFGDSSLDFQLRVWTGQPSWARLRSDLGVALQRTLRAAGIEIPFPQLDLHMRGAAEPVPPRAGQLPPPDEES